MEKTQESQSLSCEELIACCGMNCGICMAYLREKRKCPSCRASDENKNKSCVQCRIKNCPELKKNHLQFCIKCSKFPCERIKHIDKRYRTKYHMSMIENLTIIQEQGMELFLEQEQQRWKCPTCGNMISCHNLICYHCQAEVKKTKKK
jgi:hypothetical protein